MFKLTHIVQARVFVCIVLILALAAALSIRALDITSEFGGALLYMFTPTLAALIMLFGVTRDGWTRAGRRSLGLRRSRRRTWPLAAGATFMVSLIASAAVWLSPWAAFDPPAGAIDEIINLVINVILMTLTVALGEELGWRGYLLPRLRSLGRNRAFTYVGLVHSLWHMPLIFLTSLYHSDGNKLLVLPLFTATVVAASYAFGYLRLASGSVWPATIAHAVHNAAWSCLAAFTLTNHDVLVEEYLAGDNGLFIFLATIAAAWWIRRRVVARGLSRRGSHAGSQSSKEVSIGADASPSAANTASRRVTS